MTKQRAKQRAKQRKARIQANDNVRPSLNRRDLRWLDVKNPENLYVIAGDTNYGNLLNAYLGESAIIHSFHAAGGDDWGFSLCRLSAEKPENLQGKGLFKTHKCKDISAYNFIDLLGYPLGLSSLLAPTKGIGLGKLSSGSLVAGVELMENKSVPVFSVLNSKDTDTFKRDFLEIRRLWRFDEACEKQLFGAAKFDDFDGVAWKFPHTKVCFL